MPIGPGNDFSFNQYLVVDDEPLLFHTGQRQLFPLVKEAIEAVIPVERLRYLALSHFEADECGALNALLEVAPRAIPLCSEIAAMISLGDFSNRAPRALRDGEEFSTGRFRFRWFYTPARAALLGMRSSHGNDYAHVLLWRPVHPGGQG